MSCVSVPGLMAGLGVVGCKAVLYALGMTDHGPQPIGETLEALIERIVFSDSATDTIRQQWKEAKRAEQEVYERVCREAYEQRLNYHRLCQAPNPEQEARRETDLCEILLREERENRLATHWADILRRVQAVLADKVSATDMEGHEFG